MSGVPRFAACAFIYREGRLCVVLVTGRRHGAWLLPKGRPEDDLKPRKVAELEAWEEAGVVGLAHGRPSRFSVKRKGGANRSVHAYAVRVSHLAKAWPEKGQRERRVVPVEHIHRLPLDAPWRRCIERLARRV